MIWYPILDAAEVAAGAAIAVSARGDEAPAWAQPRPREPWSEQKTSAAEDRAGPAAGSQDA